MEFVAIDVETANPDSASICQIGLAHYAGRDLVEAWSSLVDPEDEFSGFHVAIHGIDEAAVAGAPTVADLVDVLYRFLDDRIAVCHTMFDRASLHGACTRYGLRPPRARWLDSARVARRTWPELAGRGYGLKNVCSHLGYDFAHHDALEDAKAAGFILNAATLTSGLDVEAWLAQVQRPIGGGPRADVRRDGNPDGVLYGEVLVFTGALSMHRTAAADLAAAAGCRVEDAVTKRTTLLVVGDRDVRERSSGGAEKSSKQQKAEALIAEGQGIRILGESGFWEVVGTGAER